MFTIPEFCRHARISRSLYYSLQRSGKGPTQTRIGSRVLIAEDTAREWLKSQENPPQTAQEKPPQTADDVHSSQVIEELRQWVGSLPSLP